MKNQAPKYQNQASGIKDVLLKYWCHWKWFVLSVVVCLVVAFCYLKLTTPVYKTTAKVKILNEESGGELPLGELLFDIPTINLENEMAVLNSYRLLEQVVDELNLTTTYKRMGRIKKTENWAGNMPFKATPLFSIDSTFAPRRIIVKITQTGFNVEDKNGVAQTTNGHSATIIGKTPFAIQVVDTTTLKKHFGTTYQVTFRALHRTVLRLSKRLKVKMDGKASEVLSVSLHGTNKAKSEAIVNKVVEKFNEDGIIDRQLVSQNTIDFVDERFDVLTKELDSIESNKQEFKRKNDLVFIDNDTQLGIEQKARSEEQVFHAETQLALSGMLDDYLKSEDYKLLPANIGIKNNAIEHVIDEYNTLVLERNKLFPSAKENHPSVLAINGDLDNVKHSIKQAVEAYKTQLRVTLKQLKLKMRRDRGVVSNLPKNEKMLRSIERQQNLKESLYLLLLQKREEAAISLGVTSPTIKVVDYAVTDFRPITPRPDMVYFQALLLGVLVPFLIFYGLFKTDTKIHSKQDVETRENSIPLLAEIPFAQAENDRLFLNPSDQAPVAEASRVLSTKVSRMLPKNETKGASVVLITSTVKGEGKTMTSLNLALAYASLNKKALLIEADLRNPKIHLYLQLGKGKTGLSEVLTKTKSAVEKAIVKPLKNNPDFDVLLSGSIPENPAQILTSNRFETILKKLKPAYDYIIIDSAPMQSVTDTLLIAQHANATLYMVRANFTEKRLLHLPEELHRASELNNMGFVVNAVGESPLYNYNYSSHKYGKSKDKKKSLLRRVASFVPYLNLS